MTPEYIRLATNKSRVKWEEVVTFLDTDGEGDKWIEDALQASYQRVEEFPLWRLLVTKRDLEQNDLVRFKVGFFFHHALGDGTSGGAFHIAFRNALNGLLAGTIQGKIAAKDEINFSPTLELLPNIERAHKLPVSYWYIFKIIIRNFIYRTEDTTHWKGPSIPQQITTTPPPTRMKSFSLDKDMTAKLIQSCRDEKSTLTALMSYTIGRKLSTMYPDYNRFSGYIPYSFRRFTNTPDDEITLQIAYHTILFTRTPNDSQDYAYTGAAFPSNIDWEVVRKLRTTIAENTKPHDSPAGIIGLAGDLFKLLRARQGTRRDVSFELSNIGAIDGGVGERSSGVVFERMMFTACIASLSAPYSFCVASAKGGDLTVVLRWEEGVVPGEEAEMLVSGLEEELRELVGKEVEVEVE